MSGGQISWPRLVGGWMLVEDTKVAQCKTTDELSPGKPNQNLIKSEIAQLEKEKLMMTTFLTRGIDTLDCVV